MPVSHRGRIGEKWRVVLNSTPDGSWRSHLHETGTDSKERPFLGEYDGFATAQKEAERRARELIKERTGDDPGPVSDWKKVPNIAPIETDSSVRQIFSIL